MSSTIALFAWLLAAHSYIDVGPDEAFIDARERIENRDFWVLRDPDMPALSAAEVRARGAIGYRVLIEVGLEDELPHWVRTVNAALSDDRGWKSAGRELLPVEDHARITVLLAKPKTVDRLCAPLRTGGKYSCGRAARATLNLDRWREGIDTWGEDIDGYRLYMINHEVGHLLGMPHKRCTGEGDSAPVMLQQTISLQGCEPRGWPTEDELDWLETRRARNN